MKYWFLISLLLTSTAWATRIEGDDGQSFDESLVGEVRGCDATKKVAVLESDRAVSLRLLELEAAWELVDLLGVRRDYVLAENRQWVDGAPRHQSYQSYWESMKNTLRLMREASQRGVNYECRSASDSQCTDVFAYVRFLFGRPRPMIYLCPTFFTMDAPSKSETVLHELSHYAASTEDYASDWWAKEKSDLARGAKDAYHLELFMNDTVTRVLTRQIWMWWWPRQ
jgi:hypothetical protein